jgi:hypothetical protein
MHRRRHGLLTPILVVTLLWLATVGLWIDSYRRTWMLIGVRQRTIAYRHVFVGEGYFDWYHQRNVPGPLDWSFSRNPHRRSLLGRPGAVGDNCPASL